MLKNENKQDEMICVLEKLMEYVPSVTTVDSVVDPDTEETVNLESHKFHRVMCGGDQLTAECIRGCKRTKSNSNTDKERLQGLEPVVEDWHSKVTLLKVSKQVQSRYDSL